MTEGCEGGSQLLPRSEWHRLSKKPLAKPRRPNVDSIVRSFLAEHDVHVRPPRDVESVSADSSGRLGAAFSGALLGGFGGPLAVGIGTLIRNQEKAAKRQEELLVALHRQQEYSANAAKWESWKRWALDHPDWPLFRDQVFDDWEERVRAAEESLQDFYSWLDSGDGREEQRKILLVLSAEKSRARSASRLLNFCALAVVVVAVFWAVSGALGVFGLLNLFVLLVAVVLCALCAYLYKFSR